MAFEAHVKSLDKKQILTDSKDIKTGKGRKEIIKVPIFMHLTLKELAFALLFLLLQVK